MSDKLMQAKVDMLERAVMELGTELFNLKGSMAKAKESHSQFLATIKGLKQLLDEKGLITGDDFEAAVELGQALEHFNSQAELAHASELEKIKKAGH
jgi:hypothetical protein